MKISAIKNLLLAVLLIGLVGCGQEQQPFQNSNQTPVGGSPTGTFTLTSGTVSPTVVVGTTANIEAKLEDENQLPVANASVTFAIDVGGGGGLFGTQQRITVLTDTSGLAIATLTAPQLVGSDKISVSYGATSQKVDISYVSDVPATIRLDASPVTVGVSSDSTLTATVFDQYGNLASGQTVVFSIVTNTSNGYLTPPTITGTAIDTTNTSGVATVVYTSGITLGIDTIRAEIQNDPTVIATTDITVSAAVTAVTSLNLALTSPTTNITVGNNTIAAEATVLDNLGNPVGGVPVAFQIVGTGDFGGVKSTIVNSNATTGVASVTLNAPILIGSAAITATTAGKSATVNVTYIPDVPAAVTLSASPATVGVSSDSTLTAALFDQHGNVLPNEPVTFSITGNNSVGAVLSNPVGTALTNASGIATMTYTSGTTTGVNDTVQVAAVNGAAPTQTATIAVSAASTSISSLNLALTSPTTNITVGNNTIAAEATVLDNLGNPVGGVPVAFQIVGTGDFGGVKSTIVNSNATTGVASVTLNAPILVGSAAITATTAGKSATVNVTYIPDVPAAVTLSASPATVGVASASALTAVVSDQHGNPSPNEAVTFTITANGSGSASGNPYLTPHQAANALKGTAMTDSNGVATITYTSGVPLTLPKTDSVQAVPVNGTATAVTTDISISASSVSIGKVTISSGSASIVADGVSTTAIRAQVLDMSNAPVVGQAVNFNTTAGVFIDGTGPNTKTTSAITDANGYAIVTLESSTDGTVPTATGTAAVTAGVSGFAASTTVGLVPGPVSTILMYVSPTTLPTGASFSFEAAVMDANNNRITKERVTFLLKKESVPGSGVYDAVVNTLEDFTDNQGLISSSFIAASVYNVATGNTLQLSATTTNGTVATQIITIDNAAVTIGSLSLAPVNNAIIADGITQTAVRATVTDGTNPVQGVSVNFTTSSGTLSATSAVTGLNGIAEVFLTSTTTTATATLTAATSGFNATAVVNFVAGPAVAANSSITVSPSSLPADGVSTATVTVTMADVNNNPVSDGTPATLLGVKADAAVTSANPAATVSGRATFTLKAASTAGTDALYLMEDSAITGSVTYGVTGTGQPASIQVASQDSQIFVAGVGQKETTSITISVKDDAGTLIANPVGYDNLRVTLLTKPNGGEFVSGLNNAGVTVTNTSFIDIATTSGQAVLNLQAGTLPGIIEVKIEVLDSVGVPTGVSAIVPQIVIASGPAHAIAFSYPLTNAVINVGLGIYQRKGSVFVADRYGNPVSDGTIVNLGMIDSVIAQGTTGDTATNPSALTDTGVDFTLANITRNGVTRFIAQNDRVLILDAIASDKSRYAASPATGANTLPVQAPYTGGQTGLSYVIGATELGATISGVDSTGNLTLGYVTTTNGTGEIRITYPANVGTILTGCVLDAPDTRTVPADSGDVYLVASASNTDATAITGKFCFSAIAGGTLTNSLIAPIQAVGTHPVTLDYRDGGDSIPLPFRNLDATVVWTKRDPASTLAVTASNPCTTDAFGQCVAQIVLTGTPVTGDKVDVIYSALHGTGSISTAISIVIP